MSAWGWAPGGVGEVVARRGGRLRGGFSMGCWREGCGGGKGGERRGDVREEVAG